MECAGRDLGQRLKHEAPLVQRRMRDAQAVILNDPVAEEQDVNINGTRPFVTRAKASHFFFYAQCESQQRSRRGTGLECEHAVQEPGLVRDINWFRFVERRDRALLASICKTLNGSAQIGCAIAQVGSERKISELRHVSPAGPFYREYWEGYLGHFIVFGVTATIRNP
jgi:hypothetical protein